MNIRITIIRGQHVFLSTLEDDVFVYRPVRVVARFYILFELLGHSARVRSNTQLHSMKISYV